MPIIKDSNVNAGQALIDRDSVLLLSCGCGIHPAAPQFVRRYSLAALLARTRTLEHETPTGSSFATLIHQPRADKQAGRQIDRERQREMGFFCVVAGRGPVAAEQQSETEFLVPSTDLLSVSYVCRRAFLARSWTSRGTPRHLVLTSTHRRLCVCRSFCVFIDGVMPVVRVARRVAREPQAPPNVDNVRVSRCVDSCLCGSV